jgi:NAD-dependent deacetylase
MKRIAVLTGAGISAESGLKTFRDSDGLWEGFDVEEVASIDGWHRNPQLVLEFYNARRRGVVAAHPNAAHLGLAKLERHFKVDIITQNIDDLHERAGSTSVLHLHGEILKMRSVRNPTVRFQINDDIRLGDMAPDGGQLRPDIVWFGEEVPLLYRAAEIVSAADIFVIIGTSLVVYPAAGLVQYAAENSLKFVLDRHIPSLPRHHNFTVIEKPATAGIFELEQLLLSTD